MDSPQIQVPRNQSPSSTYLGNSSYPTGYNCEPSHDSTNLPSSPFTFYRFIPQFRQPLPSSPLTLGRDQTAGGQRARKFLSDLSLGRMCLPFRIFPPIPSSARPRSPFKAACFLSVSPLHHLRLPRYLPPPLARLFTRYLLIAYPPSSISLSRSSVSPPLSSAAHFFSRFSRFSCLLCLS